MNMNLKIVFVLINSALLVFSTPLPKEEIQNYIKKINVDTNCGILRGYKIVPWIANIQLGSYTDDDEVIADCSGLLLNERYVLTTAECLLQKPNNTLALVFFIPEVSKDDSMYIFNTEKLIIHSDFDSSTGENNVALLRLNETISPYNYLPSICISPIPEISNTVDYFKTTWIDMFILKNSDTYLDAALADTEVSINNYTSIEVIQRKECEELFSAANLTKTLYDYEVCVEKSLLEEIFKSQEALLGTEGTPLMYTENDVTYLQGLRVKVANDSSDVPNIYHNVHTYLKWIAENIEPYPESCSRGDLLEGECVPLNSCYELKNKVQNESSDYKRYSCGFTQKENYVCCDTTVGANETQSEKNTTLKNYEICGELPNATFDYNSQPFPWSAKIYKYYSNNKTQVYICGGLIIGSRYILTTASCVEDVNTQGEVIRVHVGDSIHKQPSYCSKLPDKNSKCLNSQNIAAGTVIPHPLHSSDSSSYDLAILYLIEKITFTKLIRPICLPTEDLLKPDDELFTVFWTKTHRNHTTAESKYLTNEVCKNTLEKNNINWEETQNQMCSSNSEKKINYKCEDILSAAVLSKSYNKWYVQGNSYDTTCKENVPIRHTRIVNFRSWFEALDTTELCRTYDDFEGECVPLNLCPSLYKALSNPTSLPPNVANALICEEEGTVCCPITLEDLITEVAYAIPENIAIKRNLLNINHYCGIQQSDNYFHENTNIRLDEFPWLASLRVYNSKTNETTADCGGSLINARYVVTTAQCVKDIEDNPNKSIMVRLGEFHIENVTDCVYLPEIETQDCVNHEDFPVEKIIMHPFHDELANDIALIRLKKTVFFTDYIRPICLPTTKSLTASLKPGKSFYITGFGVPSLQADKSIMKKKLSCSLLTQEQCKVNYLSLDTAGHINTNHICTKEPETASEYTCNDDLGDPLMYSYRHQWFLAGVLSYGKQCLNKLPVVHTKLSSYIDWIIDSMEPWR